MEKQYKYSLQKGSSKSLCPECNKKTFVLYINNLTGKSLCEQYGRCDREIKCGYQKKPEFETEFTPYKVYTGQTTPKSQLQTKPQKLISIPYEVLSETLTNYENNTFIQNLLVRVPFPFESVDIENVIAQYYLGTIAGGAVTFPFIDIQNNIRAIQVKQFDQVNHTTKTTFLHSIIKHQYEQRGEQLPDWLPAYEQKELKVSCLFGEHLLSKYPVALVALVEAPKSAIYGTLYFGLPNMPERLLWLAVYNLSSLNVEKCKALIGREVFLFPDLSQDGKAFNLWSTKAKELKTKIQGAKFIVSDLLESRASQDERQKGCDIADYLICQDWRLFRNSVESVKGESEIKHYFLPLQKEIKLPSATSVKSEVENKQLFSESPKIKRVYNRDTVKENWSREIAELEKYFAAIKLPNLPVMLNQWTTISNVPLFIESHLSTLKANNGRSIFFTHLNRLQKFKQLFINN